MELIEIHMVCPRVSGDSKSSLVSPFLLSWCDNTLSRIPLKGGSSFLTVRDNSGCVKNDSPSYAFYQVYGISFILWTGRTPNPFLFTVIPVFPSNFRPPSYVASFRRTCCFGG